MKKDVFETRLQNDLFPEMPPSFGRKLKETMENEGVRIKKRPTATGVFTGAVSLVAAAAVLLIVLMGVLSGGRSDRNQAAAPGLASTSAATETPQSKPAVTAAPMTWPWSPKVFTLSTGFEFKNEEKLEALYTNILYTLMRRGESEPDELWLCAIKSRYVAADTGDRADGYLSGYYVLAQHSFGPADGPELYCLSDDFEVLWCTEGSAPGPNHAVNPEGDNYTGTYQGHFLYGMAPTTASVTRGALVGNNPKEKTDVEFSMTAWFPRITERLAGSAHLDAAREYFLFTVSAHDWDSVMRNPILRFETADGNVDVDMAAQLPLVQTVLSSRNAEVELVKQAQQGVEHWLSQNRPMILDLTDDWYGPELVEQYAEAIRRALITRGEHISDGGIWVCAVCYDGENEDGTPPERAYVVAQYAFEGETGPELFYYRDGIVEWMTQGYAPERINLIYRDGCTVVFGQSLAYDNGPLAMTDAQLKVKAGGYLPVAAELPLNKVLERVPAGPNRSAARECFIWSAPGTYTFDSLSVDAQDGDKTRQFILDKTNVLTPQPVPAMAVESGGVVYPGTVTALIQSLNENGVAAEGEPLTATLENGLLFKGEKVWQRPLTILTASDAVSVDLVDIYRVTSGDNAAGQPERLEAWGLDQALSAMDALPEGEYYLCFHTTTLGPYAQAAARYTFTKAYTVYKVTLK